MAITRGDWCVPVARRGKRFVTIDCETDPFKAGRVPQPFIWGCYDGFDSSYYEFDDAAGLLAHLAGRGVLVYAHNGGRFDFHYLRDHIDLDTAIMVIAGRLASFKIAGNEYRDSMNILVNPLRAFQKEEFDYRKLEREVRDQHMPEIRQYLKSDCVNLWHTIERYFQNYGRSLTQAGAAMRYWKREYQVPMVVQSAEQSRRYRDFYYGGRVQCFTTGHGRADFSLVDMNSAYPCAMKLRHPIAPDTRKQSHLPVAGSMSRSFVRFIGVSEGVLPFREETGRLGFPDDGVAREYTVSGWELEAGLELGRIRILRVLEVRLFRQTVDFADYVQTFYDQRLKAKASGDQVGDVFAKLFMNSLYGKFAADPEKYSEYVLADDDSLMRWRRAGYEHLLDWGERHLCERPLPEAKHRYYNVATAASITGCVRGMLMRGLAKCAGLLYCDTDSIAARDVSGLQLGDGIGEWKLVMEGDEYAIAAKKLYAFRRRGVSGDEAWKVASKGAHLSAAEIVRCARGEAVTNNPEVPTYSIYQTGPVFVPRVLKRTVLHS